MIHRKLEEGFKPNCEIKQFYSIDFLDYTAMKRGIFIQHKANLGEHRVGPFMLDGFSQSSEPNDHSKGSHRNGKPQGLRDMNGLWNVIIT